MRSYILIFMLILGQSCLCLQTYNDNNKCSVSREKSANLISYHDHTGIPRARVKYGEDFNPSMVDDHAYYAGLIMTIHDINKSSIDAYYSVCSASLVSANRLLTAAHCWRDHRYQASSVKVVLGARTLQGKGGVSVISTRVTMHPLYDPYNYLVNNIAIVSLPRPLYYTGRVNPIALPSYVLTRQFSFLNTPAVVVAYADDPDLPRVDLNSIRYEANVILIGQNDCREAYGDFIGTRHLCSKLSTGEVKDPDTCDCPGDSGGPLIVTVDSRQTLVGVAIMSNRIGCPRSPAAVYTRVLYYLDFIYDNID